MQNQELSVGEREKKLSPAEEEELLSSLLQVTKERQMTRRNYFPIPDPFLID